eukprot:scaffold2917_cov170-Ochromonas_danica.AAC.2
MEPLLWELFNSIFLNFAALERRWPHEEVVSHLQEVPTYFAKYHETLAALEDVLPPSSSSSSTSTMY